MNPRKQLRQLLAGPGYVITPGAYDTLTARLVQLAGFESVYLTGGGYSRANGYPDVGLLTMTEVVQWIARTVDTVEIPVIADMDSGYGNAVNVVRSVREYEKTGVAAFHLEDQTFPKRCGHYNDKAVVPVSEMVGKLKAVRDALHDPDVVVIARTDAIAVEGFDAAIDRCHAYVEAGADVAFLDAPVSEAQIEEIARRIPGPKLINMFHGGKTPLLPVSRLQALGYAIVIIPSDLQRAAIKAMQRALAAIARDGSSLGVIEHLAPFDEREAIVATDEFIARGKRYEK